MLIDSLKGKPLKQLPPDIQKGSIITAAEIQNPKEIGDRLDKVKKDLQRSNTGSVLLLAVKI